MNQEQRQILRAWLQLLGDFLRDEWRSAAVGYGSGAFVATFAGFIKTYTGHHTEWAWDGTNLSMYRKMVDLYAPNLWFVLAPLALIVMFKVVGVAGRAARSWLQGVTSGASFWPFVVALVFFWDASQVSARLALMALGVSSFMLLLGFVLSLTGDVVRARTIDPEKVKFGRRDKATYASRDSDSPIISWADDRLGRSSLVEMLALKVLVSKTPVIALRGKYGDGKSSVLNLLRLQLGKKAIVVSFSSWLPDSQQTLVSDLFGDIASEGSKQFVIPGLRKRLRKFASLLGGTLPYLKFLPDVLSAYTQRQEIRDLGQVLRRIPKRVVVLLDEIDRMQKDELLVLLKVIRGASALPNVTFVCAFQQEQFETLACGKYDASSHEFLEKFFPTTVDLPKPSTEVLRSMLFERVLGIFEKTDWFKEVEEQTQFAKDLNQLWNETLGLVCTNIRKVSLLANDVQASALLVRKEVNPLDLCTLEAARRFYPRVHELIWTNAAFFSNSNSWWKSPVFRTDAEVATETAQIANSIKKIWEGSDDEPVVKALLTEMFPVRTKELFDGRRRVAGANDEALHEAGKRKRIAHPDYFPIYFRREVPETMFSSLEMDKFEDESERAVSDEERLAIFEHNLNSLEAGSVRRYDFIYKVALKLEVIQIDVARSIAYAIVRNAEKFGNEFLVNEGQRALSGVFAVAERLSGSHDVNTFITSCIYRASTDLLAARLYRLSTIEREQNLVLRNFKHVLGSAIRDAFVERMRVRYGDGADVLGLDLARVDVHAFWVWSSISPSERDSVIAFWERAIGQSRQRLAEAFKLIAPAELFWNKDARASIEQMIPAEILTRMYRDLVPHGPLDQAHEESLARLKKFLDGI